MSIIQSSSRTCPQMLHITESFSSSKTQPYSCGEPTDLLFSGTPDHIPEGLGQRWGEDLHRETVVNAS